MSEKSRYAAPHLVTYGDVRKLTQDRNLDPKGKVSVGPDAFTQKSLDEELGS
jgi:hypothetical protein